ncbi:PREDICTED: chromatin assembly factor 1 subunit B [Diuraphis noxia]|uniref:chromatin assembly factor 1 subunit B n=1 Tax=Diuraphis noxia TaxID=143948 RepID=UPI000763B2F2|nr:PREDICTED: chromatin assembly factor 1 subunit B [Diuraphis noxia]XP_015375343.1 PREDICTED: chromatin assembly factor 1 subunit B [Diuraphis noxia]XP_015375344.1 PREDICTED: chromatin assembly factor 1 subunit B [Diuraphis noxia]
MKLVIPEISWHNRDPVLSVHFQPVAEDGYYRLATGGSDSHVFIWRIKVDGSNVTVEFAADLTKHQKAVNTVRFSPNGQWLATGDDESVIVLWKFKPENGPDQRPDLLEDDESKNLEKWVCHCVLRGHLEDVYDLSWSPDSKRLISGGVDNKAIIWDVDNGRYKAILDDHKGFVQGVAWDPLNVYAATLSSDRTLRVFNTKNCKLFNKCDKCVPLGKKGDGDEIKIRLFHDDTLKSFFRRISFSPDGQILVTSSGIMETINEENKNKSTTNVSYVFARKSFTKPVLYIPSLDQYSVAVQFSPVLYELKEDTTSIFDLPYRMIYAIATNSSILLMDTQHAAPFAYIGDIHYTRLTDLSWSSDGQLLIVSSSDGFCSIICFTKEELGIMYKNNTKVEPMEMVESVVQDCNEDKELPIIVTPLKREQKHEEKQIVDCTEAPPTKKRVQLVTLSSPKNNKYLNK